MVTNLKAMELLNFEPYSNVQPTSLGLLIGNYLLYRHQVVHQFLCLLNDSSDELRQAEKIEHFLNKTTISNLHLLIEKDIW
jgi:DtxR family Mn-dependent transcriptional regulator